MQQQPPAHDRLVGTAENGIKVHHRFFSAYESMAFKIRLVNGE